MSKLIRFAVTTREQDGYTVDEAEDDIRAALDQAGIVVEAIELRAVDYSPAPAEADK